MLLYLFSDLAIYFGVVMSLWISFRILNYPDLALQQLFAFGGGLYAFLEINGVPILAQFPIFVVIAMALGFLCGFLRNRLSIHPILIALSVGYICYSLYLVMLGRPNLYFGTAEARPDRLTTLLVPGAFFCILCIVVSIVSHTRLGLRIIAAGCNPTLAARHKIGRTFAQSIGLASAFFSEPVNKFETHVIHKLS